MNYCLRWRRLFCRGVAGLCGLALHRVCDGDGVSRALGRRRGGNLRRPIPGFTFLQQDAAGRFEPERALGADGGLLWLLSLAESLPNGMISSGRKALRVQRIFLTLRSATFAEKCSSGSRGACAVRPSRPAAGRQAHQCLGGELRRLAAVDDGRDDVGREPGEAQDHIEMRRRQASPRERCHARELGVLDQPRLDVVGAGEDPEQARIGRRRIVGVRRPACAFRDRRASGAPAPSTSEYRPVHSSALAAASTDRSRSGQQLGQAASRERDVDAIGSDFHAAEERHERRFDFVRRAGCRVRPRADGRARSVGCSPDPPCDSLSRASRTAPGSARKVRSLLITRPSRLPAGIRRPLDGFLPAPVTREVET